MPNGLIGDTFFPEAAGPLGDLPSVLAPLDAYRSRMSVFGGMHNMAGLISEPSGHAGTACLLTDMPIVGLEKLSVGRSIDQVIAEQVSSATPFPSLQLGTAQGGRPQGDISDIYRTTLTYAAADLPLLNLTDPTALFDLLFPSAVSGQSAAHSAMRSRVVDFAHQRTKDLKKQLAWDEKRRLGEYLAGLEHLGTRMDLLEKMSCEAPLPPLAPGSDWETVTDLMGDLMVTALQCDFTRVLTFMLGPSGSCTTFDELGATTDHHSLGHDFNKDERWRDELEVIELWEMGLFKAFLDKMAAAKDTDGSDLLSNTMVILCSEFSDHSEHSAENIPMAVFGGECAGFSHGNYHFNDGRAHSDLWLDAVEFMEVQGVEKSEYQTGPIGI